MKLKLSQIKRAIMMVKGQLSSTDITYNSVFNCKKNNGVIVSIRRFRFEEIDGKIKAIYTTQKNKVIKVGL